MEAYELDPMEVMIRRDPIEILNGAYRHVKGRYNCTPCGQDGDALEAMMIIDALEKACMPVYPFAGKPRTH